MGKPTGFLEFTRQEGGDRLPLERLQDWSEFHESLPEAELRQQGARCMDCGTPFCHTGQLLKGMASGCPIHNLIPEWNDLVFRGLWQEALERLQRTNNFPEVTGRVCPAPCEGACVLGINNPPVTIKSLEAAIADRGWASGWVTPRPPQQRSGRTVAVVGSGPAGLAAADQLNQAGHAVTVFERADRPGGLLMYGIPNMKLDKQSVVLRRIELLEAEGITIRCGVEIGRDLPAEELLQDFDAVVLCTGATVPRDLSVPGREATGIHFAMDYLTGSTRALLDGTAPPISAAGQDVVIIGGGDTGTDCVGTALRQGCRSLVQLEIMPCPPLERAADNPWPEWPRIARTDYGQTEAIARFGQDPRRYCTTATGFEVDDQGTVSGVRTARVDWQTDERGRRPVPVPGSEAVIPAQRVLLAMGFLGPEQPLLDGLGVDRDARSNVLAREGDYATSLPGVFAAGDCRRGQSLVVWAIHEGRGAAAACDHYLRQGAATDRANNRFA